MPLPREEQESVSRCGYGEAMMEFSTTNPVHARTMEKLGLKAAVTCIDGDLISWIFTCPASWFKLPRPKKRVSDEQRAARSERMKGRGVRGQATFL